MNRIFLILCIFIGVVTSASAGELYSCIDSSGKSIITDSPQDGMENCVLKDAYDDLTPAQRTAQQREIEAGRQRLNAQADKYYSAKRQQELRNRQADMLLQTYKDIGFKASSKNRDTMEKAAEVQAEQIRQGTNKPMTAQEDADFHTQQKQRELERKQQEIQWKQQEIERKQRELEFNQRLH